MMVLLIIFMLTAPFIQAGIKIKLPRAKAPVVKEAEGVVLSIDEEGTVYLNNAKVDRERLPDALRNLKVAGEERVFVRADKNVAYGAVISVIGEVKAVGIDEVGMITEIESKKKR